MLDGSDHLPTLLKINLMMIVAIPTRINLTQHVSVNIYVSIYIIKGMNSIEANPTSAIWPAVICHHPRVNK